MHACRNRTDGASDGAAVCEPASQPASNPVLVDRRSGQGRDRDHSISATTDRSRGPPQAPPTQIVRFSLTTTLRCYHGSLSPLSCGIRG